MPDPDFLADLAARRLAAIARNESIQNMTQKRLEPVLRDKLGKAADLGEDELHIGPVSEIDANAFVSLAEDLELTVEKKKARSGRGSHHGGNQVIQGFFEVHITLPS